VLTTFGFVYHSNLRRGHTWNDLADSAISMAQPFNILRCLHIWKPSNRAWGYDLIMATAMRIGNNQLGCQPEDLNQFLRVLHRVGLPHWLDGTIDLESDQAWQMYISETIDNIYGFWKRVNTLLLSGYLGVVVVSAIFVQWRCKAGGLRILFSATLGVLVTHMVVLSVTWWILAGIGSSEWAVGISSGRTLQRPFPRVDATALPHDHFVSTGSTALPTREDVLVGTRLASKTLGIYSRLLDFHPGNLAFRQEVDDMVMMGGSQGTISRAGGWSLYNSYAEGLPSIFSNWILDTLLENVETRGGRFLHQDYRTGDWRLMNTAESREYVRLTVSTGTYGVAAEVMRGIDFLMGDYRFGMFRGTALSKKSQVDLHHLTKKLFITAPQKVQRSQQQLRLPLSLFSLSLDLAVVNATKHLPSLPQSRRWTQLPKPPLSEIRSGTIVLTPHRGESGNVYPATVVYDHGNEHFDILFSGEVAEHRGLGQSNVPLRLLRKASHPLEGMRATVNYEDMGEWFQATIVRIRPNGVDVVFDDGDFEVAVPPSRFQVID
jgi:hypothetical protein